MVRIRQSTIKAFKREKHCPRKINESMILRKVENLPTDSMLKGKIFEQLCFGLITPEDPIIPKLRNGKLSVDYERIIQQAEFFRNKFSNDYKINIHEKNIRLEYQYADDIILEGEIDAIGEILDISLNDKPIMGILDIKLTKNIYNQYGDFCWAYPFNMDHSQPFMYTKLWKENFGPEIPFFYLVFDYKPTPEFKVIRKQLTGLESLEFQEDIRKTHERIIHYNQHGWPEIPSFEECKGCPLSVNCKSFLNHKPIEVV